MSVVRTDAGLRGSETTPGQHDSRGQRSQHVPSDSAPRLRFHPFSPILQIVGAVAVPGYDLGDRIGAGGFGEVFRARHALLGRDVAIKILNSKYSADPEAVARFVAEA